MKAIVIKEQYGLDHVALGELNKPLPAPDEVLVKVNALSLNQLDIMVAEGVFGNHLPHTLGSDAAGVVKAVGSDVSALQVGDRVVTHFIKDWDQGELTKYASDLRLGVGSEGVFAEYIALPQSAFVKVPANLTDEEASTLPIAAVTAWQSLINITKLSAGETVLLQGTGGVSIFALQFAKAKGAKVIITSGSDEKLKRAKALGADLTINYKTQPDWENKVMELTNNQGADVAISVSWIEISKTIAAMAMGGRIAVVGLLGGTDTEVSVSGIIGKNLAINGIQTGSRDAFKAMNRAIDVNKIKPVIDKVFPVSAFRDAFAYLKEAKHFGKVVIKF
jgi:NADPH:quinone reductase-like Zn-dependent oxidoreductase